MWMKENRGRYDRRYDRSQQIERFDGSRMGLAVPPMPAAKRGGGKRHAGMRQSGQQDHIRRLGLAAEP